MENEPRVPIVDAGEILVLEKESKQKNFLIEILKENHFSVSTGEDQMFFGKFWFDKKRRPKMIFLDTEIEGWQKIVAILKIENPEIPVIARTNKEPTVSDSLCFSDQIDKKAFAGQISEVLRSFNQ